MKKKKIGIIAWKTGQNSLGITLAYYNYLRLFGDVHLIEPNMEVQENLDLLVLPGGPDIPQTEYMKEDDDINLSVGKSDTVRYGFFKTKLEKYIEKRIPLFGICLGHQMLAVKLADGTLEPHMYHETSEPDERFKKVHSINVHLPLDYPLLITNIKHTFTTKVNSLHHQAVNYFDEKKAISIANYAGKEDDKYTEALLYTDYPAASVQWHPEEIWDALSHQLILNLLQNER